MDYNELHNSLALPHTLADKGKDARRLEKLTKLDNPVNTYESCLDRGSSRGRKRSRGRKILVERNLVHFLLLLFCLGLFICHKINLYWNKCSE